MVFIYLDSCIVMGMIEGDDANRTGLRLKVRERAGAVLCTSEMVKLECLVGALRRSDERLAAMYNQFFADTLMLEFSPGVWRQAVEIRAATRLKVPDALHLAAAEVHGCSEFWTNDLHFSGLYPASGLKIVRIS